MTDCNSVGPASGEWASDSYHLLEHLRCEKVFVALGQQNRQRILGWGENHLPEIFRAPFANADDHLCHADDYLRFFPEAEQQKLALENRCGITQ